MYNSTDQDEISGGRYTELISSMPRSVYMHAAMWIDEDKVSIAGSRRRLSDGDVPDADYFDPGVIYVSQFDFFAIYAEDSYDSYTNYWDFYYSMDGFTSYTLLSEPNLMPGASDTQI